MGVSVAELANPARTRRVEGKAETPWLVNWMESLDLQGIDLEISVLSSCASTFRVSRYLIACLILSPSQISSISLFVVTSVHLNLSQSRVRPNNDWKEDRLHIRPDRHGP